MPLADVYIYRDVVGKIDRDALPRVLNGVLKRLPRTALHYAIGISSKERHEWMAK